MWKRIQGVLMIVVGGGSLAIVAGSDLVEFKYGWLGYVACALLIVSGLAQVTRADPPATAAPAHAAPIAAPSARTAVAEPCGFCDRIVSGVRVEHDAWVGQTGLGRADIVGFACPECGTVSHAECSRSGIRFHWWSGYAKSVCEKCGKPVPRPRVVLPGLTEPKADA